MTFSDFKDFGFMVPFLLPCTMAKPQQKSNQPKNNSLITAIFDAYSSLLQPAHNSFIYSYFE